MSDGVLKNGNPRGGGKRGFGLTHSEEMNIVQFWAANGWNVAATARQFGRSKNFVKKVVENHNFNNSNWSSTKGIANAYLAAALPVLKEAAIKGDLGAANLLFKIAKPEQVPITVAIFGGTGQRAIDFNLIPDDWNVMPDGTTIHLPTLEQAKKISTQARDFHPSCAGGCVLLAGQQTIEKKVAKAESVEIQGNLTNEQLDDN